MAYSTADELFKIWPLLETAGLSKADIDEYIADADQQINAKLSQLYLVPFATGVDSLPPVINLASKHLALADIFEERLAARTDDQLPGWLEKRRERYTEMVDGLAAGSYTLVLSSGVAVGTKTYTNIRQSVLWSSTKDYHPIFNHLDYTRQQVCKDRLDAEEDELE